MGTSGFYAVNGVYYSHAKYSSGGKVKVCVSTKETGTKSYALYEFDKVYDDQRIGSVRRQKAGGCEVWNVSGYTDGKNGKAEVYIATNDSKAYRAVTYD
ncbi:hypothetical protein [Streptomyces sp. NPDC005438]|uniref:hypothetical protein n=1 Tax=Streptomyces sp. NPDC005438 TaxID=3156880 RepID=UPI0033BF6FD9